MNARTDRRCLMKGKLEHNENRLLFSPANCTSKRDMWNGTIVPYRYCSKNALMHALSVQF